MKIAVTGADGFIGSAVVRRIKDENEVVQVSFVQKPDFVQIDLTDLGAVRQFIGSYSVDAFIHCAGIVENTDRALMNIKMTMNLLQAIDENGANQSRVVILGSASEYGEVDNSELPVKESHPIAPISIYGSAKAEEISSALRFSREKQVSMVVCRLFNPIGRGMHERLLIPQVLKQLQGIVDGEDKAIEIGRADACRDYVNVDDVASAIALLATTEHSPQYDVYNIGSGVMTSNEQLVKIIVQQYLGDKKITIIQTSNSPETPMAAQADITRFKSEFGWRPTHSLEETIKEIVHG